MSENNGTYVNVSCANIYRKNTFHSEIDTQAVLWEELQILDQAENFLQVRTEDNYLGWINRNQVASLNQPKPDSIRLISRPQALFFDHPRNDSQSIRDGFAGISIPVTNRSGDWLQTRFPDGIIAWIEQDKLKPMPALSRSNLIRYAKYFLGIPYYWGGKTPKGFDCSGFIQFVHKMFGLKLRRDSWMQFEDSKFVSENPLGGELGDLMFFAEDGKKITHVGLCLGQGYLLHARGLIRINVLLQDHPLYDETLWRDFVAVKTFLDN